MNYKGQSYHRTKREAGFIQRDLEVEEIYLWTRTGNRSIGSFARTQISVTDFSLAFTDAPCHTRERGINSPTSRTC